MSTYNGEKYLREQVDSILIQEGVDVHLLVRDDGSKDDTIVLLEEYSSSHVNVEIIKGENVGFVKSFTKLVVLAQSHKDIDYYAFSDQDDVWFPEKLKIACERLSCMCKDVPSLITTNSYIVDEKLNQIKKFHEEPPYRTIPNVMIFPTEQGCSMVFNGSAVEMFCQYPPQNNVPHDRWMHMMCNFMGQSYYEHTPQFYYRLHNNNAIGLKTGIIERINNDIIYLFKGYPTHREYAKAFIDSFGSVINDEGKRIIDVYLNYPHVPKYKIKIIFDKRFAQSLKIGNRLRKGLLAVFNKV